jgi:pimeloyl-ACP methyl ester carboxylesterase
VPFVSRPATQSVVVAADGTEIAVRTLGRGPGLVLVGGSLATSEDYLPLADALSGSFTVHVMDRRGRGRSGPQQPGHDLDVEVSDLLAVQAATGASVAFGHSFGGLVCLDAARRTDVFDRIAVYEPGVLIGGPAPGGWLPSYRGLLASGDRRGAFAVMVRSGGTAPRPLRLMPLWYSRLVLRLVVRGERWAQMEPLLETNATEHELIASVGDSAERYAGIRARTLILVGARSPASTGRDLLSALLAAIPGSRGEVLDGLGHLAATDGGARTVAQEVLRGLGADDPAPGTGASTAPR